MRKLRLRQVHTFIQSDITNDDVYDSKLTVLCTRMLTVKPKIFEAVVKDKLSTRLSLQLKNYSFYIRKGFDVGNKEILEE